MACRRCSKIRCRLYGIVAGVDARYGDANACGPTKGCHVYDKNGCRKETKYFDPKNQTLRQYFGILVTTLSKRITRNFH